MFPMTLTLHNPAQLNAVLAALNLGTTEPTTADLVQLAKDRGAIVKADTAGKSVKAGPAPGPTTATKTDAPDKTADASAPAAAPAAAESQASTAATEAVTYEQVAKAITEGVKADRAKVIETLGKFGAKKGPDLKPEQYADFMAALA